MPSETLQFFRYLVGSTRFHVRTRTAKCYRVTRRSIVRPSRNFFRWVLRKKPRYRVEKDDVYLVSYPKSGNTWLRFLVAALLSQDEGEEINFHTIDERVPDLYKAPIVQLWESPRPRYLKSHERYRSSFKKVIYVVRDPRDILVSYFHYQKKMNRIAANLSLEKYAERFLNGKVDRFGGWQKNVQSWLKKARWNHRQILLLRYEDMLKNTEEQVIKMAQFLDLPCTASRAVKIVQACRFSRLQELEKKENWNPGRRAMRKDIPFMRSGRESQWKEAVPKHIIQKLEDRWGTTMSQLGYFVREGNHA